MKKLLTITFTSILALMAYNTEIPNFNLNEAEARSRGFSSRSFSSRSFSYKSSSRRSSGKSMWNRSKSSSGKYKKSSKTKSKTYKKSTKKITPTKKFSTKSYTSKAAQKKVSAKSIATHRKQTSVFKKTSPKLSKASVRNNPVASRANIRRVSYNTYYARRDNYYARSGWHRPVYYSHSYSRFGVWDGLFMWAMLDNHRSWAYHHRNDPGYNQWRQEANRLSADNVELKQKLAKLDADMTSMKGTPINAEYMPKDVSSDIALAADVVASKTGDLVINVGTGSQFGNYYAFCNYLTSTTLKINCVNTKGSVENLNGLVKGQFGAIMVQSDVINAWYRKNPNANIKALQSDVYPEVVFMLVNKKTGVTSIKDLDMNKHRVYFAGSGARKTLAGLAYTDSSYIKVAKEGVQVSANRESLEMLANNPNGIMFYVCGLNCGFIKQANSINNLQLAAVDDWDFNDVKDQFGNKIYRFVEIPRIYKNLMPSKWGSDNIETLAVSAVFIVSSNWVAEKSSKGLSAIEAAAWPAMTKIQNKVGVPE